MWLSVNHTTMHSEPHYDVRCMRLRPSEPCAVGDLLWCVLRAVVQRWKWQSLLISMCFVLTGCAPGEGAMREVKELWPNGNIRVLGQEIRAATKSPDLWGKTGLWEVRYESGRLEERGAWKNRGERPSIFASRDGWWRYWYEGGAPRGMCYYTSTASDGQPSCEAKDGCAVFWDEHGVVNELQSGIFAAGVRVRSLTSEECETMRTRFLTEDM
jgi:hypothetical protein